jgi:hypothetical protein
MAFRGVYRYDGQDYVKAIISHSTCLEELPDITYPVDDFFRQPFYPTNRYNLAIIQIRKETAELDGTLQGWIWTMTNGKRLRAAEKQVAGVQNDSEYESIQMSKWCAPLLSYLSSCICCPNRRKIYRKSIPASTSTRNLRTSHSWMNSTDRGTTKDTSAHSQTASQ